MTVDRELKAKTMDQPPVRRSFRPSVGAHLAAPPVRRAIIRPKPPRTIFLLFFLLLILAALLWRPHLQRLVAKLSPAIVNPTSPEPGPTIDPRLIELRNALKNKDIGLARALLDQLQANGRPSMDELQQLTDLERETRARLELMFLRAQESQDAPMMATAMARYREFWPQAPILADWEQASHAFESKLAIAARIENLDAAYEQAISRRHFRRAEELLNELGELGQDIAPRMAALVKTIQLPGGALMRFRKVPAGVFQMGSPENEPGRRADETLHRVTLTKDYWLAETEATQKHWQSVIGSNQSQHKGPSLPMEQVSWQEIQTFIDRINAAANKPIVRLPTEAEWEYACRAGTQTPFATGPNLTTEQANYDGNYPYNNNAPGVYRAKTTPARSFPPNAWGLFDMHGNVWEWCDDKYAPYGSESVTDPMGSTDFQNWLRVFRGGGYGDYAESCRSARRIKSPPNAVGPNIGFRLVYID